MPTDFLQQLSAEVAPRRYKFFDAKNDDTVEERIGAMEELIAKMRQQERMAEHQKRLLETLEQDLEQVKLLGDKKLLAEIKEKAAVDKPAPSDAEITLNSKDSRHIEDLKGIKENLLRVINDVAKAVETKAPEAKAGGAPVAEAGATEAPVTEGNAAADATGAAADATGAAADKAKDDATPVKAPDTVVSTSSIKLIFTKKSSPFKTHTVKSISNGGDVFHVNDALGSFKGVPSEAFNILDKIVTDSRKITRELKEFGEEFKLEKTTAKDQIQSALTPQWIQIQTRAESLNGVARSIQYQYETLNQFSTYHSDRYAIAQSKNSNEDIRIMNQTIASDLQRLTGTYNDMVRKVQEYNSSADILYTEIGDAQSAAKKVLNRLIEKEEESYKKKAAGEEIEQEDNPNKAKTAATALGAVPLIKLLVDKLLKKKQSDDRDIEFVKELKANHLYPDDVLAVDSRDKGIFLGIAFVVRMISLYIVSFMVDRRKIKTFTGAMLGFFILYLFLLAVITLAVNLDTYRSRIMLNFFNLHINGPGLSTHIIVMGAAIFLIFQFMDVVKFPMKGIKFVAETDADRAKLNYQLEMLTFMSWVVTAMVTYFIS